MTERRFNPDDPLAYFLTWTTYGSWLPGDDRGWWHKSDGERYESNEWLHEISALQMVEGTFLLSDSDRAVVKSTVGRHCEIRCWRLHALSARSNHVHVVVTTPGYPPETVRDQLKAWCTRNLKPCHKSRKRFWTEGASCRSINHEQDLEKAIVYVNEAQGRKDRDHA